MEQEAKSNNKRRLFLIILVLGILIVSGVGVWAFESGMDASVMGHSGDEINVSFRGGTPTINQALNDLHNDAVALENQI